MTISAPDRSNPKQWILQSLWLSMLLVSCGQPAQEPVTLRYPHGWRLQPDEISTRVTLAQEFTQQTGIQIREMPAPDNTFDQLDLWRKLLKGDTSGIDLLGMDMIWSATLDPYLIDLAPYSATEVSSLEPQLLPDYTVNGRLVAIPDQVNVGALEYRSDLLREYGYDHPPRTWNELERMAKRIQAGERAKGKKDFWGYVWQGVATEALTCNALEWQVARGLTHLCISCDRLPNPCRFVYRLPVCVYRSCARLPNGESRFCFPDSELQLARTPRTRGLFSRCATVWASRDGPSSPRRFNSVLKRCVRPTTQIREWDMRRRVGRRLLPFSTALSLHEPVL
jgi:hypothetical protein